MQLKTSLTTVYCYFEFLKDRVFLSLACGPRVVGIRVQGNTIFSPPVSIPVLTFP